MTAMSKHPFWVRHADKATFLFRMAAYLGGGGIIAYQAVIWFLYTEFNYMSLDWFFSVTKTPFFSDGGSWYNQPDRWEQFHTYFKLAMEWIPLSVAVFLLGNFLAGFIDERVNGWHRSHIQKGDPYENL
jgi:hypothetical protein